jgi:hypothetical protein
VVFGALSGIAPLHCLNEALVLSSHTACAVAGDTRMASFISQPRLPIYVDLYTEISSNDWSFDPVCTEFFDELDSKLCVYTNSTFGGGRGISIFTTPEIVDQFRQLPVIQHGVSDVVESTSGPWYTKELPGKGIAMLANHQLTRGDRITAFTPVLLVNVEKKLPAIEGERLLRRAIDQLPLHSRKAYLSLSTMYNNPAVVVQDVLKSNTFEVQVGGKMHLAIVPEPARINHDCAPKYV